MQVTAVNVFVHYPNDAQTRNYDCCRSFVVSNYQDNVYRQKLDVFLLMGIYAGLDSVETVYLMKKKPQIELKG